MWAIAADKSFTVLRQDLSVVANQFSAFSSDSTQVRGVMRAAFGFTSPAVLCKEFPAEANWIYPGAVRFS